MEAREVPSKIQLLTPDAPLLAGPSSEGQSQDAGEMVCESWDITETQPDQDLEEFLKDFGFLSEWLPPCGERIDCGSICDVSPSCQDISLMDSKLLPLEFHLRVLMGEADGLQSDLVNNNSHSQDHSEKEGFVVKVRNLLHTSQAYFTYLESTARSRMPQHTPPPTYISSRLLDFSQQLCMRFEQLVLYCAFNNILSLDQIEPDSLSHFYIGQCQIDGVMVTMFRYCGPVPYDARADTGMYTRMRWNVQRPRDNQLLQTDPDHHREAVKKVTDTFSDPEYYFLCYEDTPELRTEINENTGEEEIFATGGVVRTWTIGQWVQTHPDPETETIDDWILCEVPQGRYDKLLCLDSEEEPSTHHATSCILATLFKQMA